MTNAAEIKTAVRNKLNADKVGGYSIEELWRGVHPDARHLVAFALRDLMTEGFCRLTEKRVFDSVGNAETVPSYRVN